MSTTPNLPSLLEKAKETIETAQLFGKQSSEILFAVFCMLIVSLGFYGIASLLQVNPYTIFITLPFVSLAALAGGFLLFRLLTGRFAQERKVTEIKGNTEIIERFNEILENIEKMRELNRGSLTHDLETVRTIMDFIDEVKQLPEGSEDRELAMQLANSCLKRFEKFEEATYVLQNKAINSSLPKELKALPEPQSPPSEELMKIPNSRKSRKNN